MGQRWIFAALVGTALPLFGQSPTPIAAPSATNAPQTVAVPPENASQGTMPPMSSAESLSQQIITILKDPSARWQDSFFPRDPFIALKDIPRQDRYFDQLLKWYELDLERERKKIGTANLSNLQFVSFKNGYCRWKKPGSEYNKIGYWACSRNIITAQAGEQKFEIKLQAMINWGNAWFPTHLGPIPKQ